MLSSRQSMASLDSPSVGVESYKTDYSDIKDKLVVVIKNSKHYINLNQYTFLYDIIINSEYNYGERVISTLFFRSGRRGIQFEIDKNKQNIVSKEYIIYNNFKLYLLDNHIVQKLEYLRYPIHYTQFEEIKQNKDSKDSIDSIVSDDEETINDIIKNKLTKDEYNKYKKYHKRLFKQFKDLKDLSNTLKDSKIE